MREIRIQYNHDFQTVLGMMILDDDYAGLYDLIQKGEIFEMSAIIHHEKLIGINISPIPKIQKDIKYDREVFVDVLVYHYQNPNSSCGCGWAELGKSWPEHVANIYEESMNARM